MIKKLGLPFAALSAWVVSGTAMAQASGAVDVSEAISTIESSQGTLVTIGGALIGVAAVVMGIRWAKAMFF